jgi:hypothetical protein
MRQATIHEINIIHMLDESPDLSYLDQFKDSKNPEEQKAYVQDQKRKQAYDRGRWHMIGIKAVATIHIPFEVITNNGKETNFEIETIDSGGLWGIESNSGKPYLKQVATEQIEELKGYLQTLNVDLSSFASAKALALKSSPKQEH